MLLASGRRKREVPLVESAVPQSKVRGAVTTVSERERFCNFAIVRIIANESRNKALNVEERLTQLILVDSD